MADIPQEVRTMDTVKRACIAYNQILLNQPEDQRDQTLAMKAAIRAMLEGLEPVACMHVRNEITTYSCGNIGLGRPYGWTDTPLYDLSAIKDAVK